MATEECSTNQGAVELREDAPLKAGATHSETSASRYIAGCFTALTLAVTVALLTQLYSGHYQVVPHGAVSTTGDFCSAVGAHALRVGGGAVDGAVGAALCLALTRPETTGIDSNGALLVWAYRKARHEHPTLAKWDADPGAGRRPPRLVAALAHVHARYGRLPWAKLLQQTISKTESLTGELSNGLHEYLTTLQTNTSQEWSQIWHSDKYVRFEGIEGATIDGGWRLYAPGDRTTRALAGLPADNDDRFIARVASVLQSQQPDETGTGTGIAVVDHEDVYLSLVIGSAGASRQRALTPAILVEDDVCGRRFVLAAGDWLALLQVSSRLRRSSLRVAVESYRLLACCDRVLLEESAPAAARSFLSQEVSLVSASEWAVNVVSQSGDRLQAHADSRGHGVASRF